MNAHLVVDSHCHFYPVYTAQDFFNWAVRNGERHASHFGGALHAICLMLTESAQERSFERLWKHMDLRLEGWDIRSTGEPGTLAAERKDSPRLYVIAGTQAVSSEGLEVLSLGARVPHLEGRPLREVLAGVRQAEGCAVLPWGFGKWRGGRGRLVREMVESTPAGTLLLGDNGGRWRGMGRPEEFARAERRGIPVLPGSDPLPLAREVRRVCSYAFALDGPIDDRRPGKSILNMIRQLSTSPPVLGGTAGFWTFAAGQSAMQWARRMGSPR